ncbi:site-2 protease family protein [Nocardioides houyundeii]|uniref:site-2 protease family protein n=1 Tax=Nocardioides houyundeii TaxID=2045452 RepID=UPI001F07B49E|nr:site-2 protease family protein [Nocardioides houyundeii]
MSEPSQSRQQAPGTERPRRPPGTLRIGSIAGADVLVSTSWFFIAAIIAVLVAPRIEQVEPGLGVWKYVAGVVFAVMLYLSVLLHEASHAHMARHYGYPVTSITLHFLGGMTAIEGESRTARQELVIAVVGPLTSLLVGAAALAAWFVVPEGLLQVAIEGLAGANLLVGVLNLVPGLPLDGGRVLKAVVWGATGNMHRGTMVAGWGGRIIALLILSWPLFQNDVLGVPPGFVDYLLVVVLALFLWAGASASMHQAQVRRRLPALDARRLARRSVTVAEGLPLAQAVRLAQEAQAGSIVTLGPDGRPSGIVSEAALLATPVERRPWVPVSSVARSLEDGLALSAGIAGEELVRAISHTPAQEYLLLDADGAVYGVLSTVDVDRAFREAAH